MQRARVLDHQPAPIDGHTPCGQPRLVISLIYTGCTHVCPMTTQRLRQAVEEAQRLMGSDRFTVISVGFDVRNDTPMRMAAFARAGRRPARLEIPERR